MELSDKEKVILKLLEKYKKPSLADSLKNFNTSIYEVNKQKVEHELSQKPTIKEKLDYWAEIKGGLSIEDQRQIYDKYIQNYLSTNEGSYWSLVSKAKEYEIHFIREISWKLNSEYAINVVRSEIKAMEAIENEVKQLLDTGVDIEQAYKDFKYHFDEQNQIENAKYGKGVNKEQHDIFRRKEEQLEVYRIKTNYYKSKSFNDYSVIIYSKYKFYKPYLETKLKELEQTSPATLLTKSNISTPEKKANSKVVKPTTKEKHNLKLYAICDLVEKEWRNETVRTVEQLEKIYKKVKGKYAESKEIDRSQLNEELKNTDGFEYIKIKLMNLYREKI